MTSMSAIDPTPEAPRVATPADSSLVTRILVDAFDDDPMWGAWAFPDPRTRRRGRLTAFRLLVEGALRYPWVWLTAANAATAVWIPPGESELSPAQEQGIETALKESLGTRAAAALEALETLSRLRPTEPHYYLTMLGTDPVHRGRGVGGQLLKANLQQVDAAGAPAYLEAADKLVSLYQRSGFRLLKRLAMDDGPTVNTMWRGARSLMETADWNASR